MAQPSVRGALIDSQALGQASHDAMGAPHIAAMPASPASTSLRLDSGALRKIMRESRSNFQQLTEASGAYAGDQKMSASQKLSASVDAATKPDCLDRSGAGSLFSIPIIAYQLVKDKCK